MNRFLIIILLYTVISSCNRTTKTEENATETLEKESDKFSTMTPSPIWIYDYDQDVAIKNRSIPNDSLNPRDLINLLNAENGGNLKLDFVKLSVDTIYVKMDSSTYLTQEMGTTGANSFMAISTYTLTELNGIKFVNFDFKEGDHAIPGTYTRKYFENRKVPME
ncbi:hypothetical protein FAZ15_16380 [Sphingobacterium olei]|uniref:GerMN domain-containing protein n=1 Tax=Sphingobacterium olei TaxID=2571155 RepID=A0A4U0NHN5_9SPHI|nr:hypothetical protein [Sphingobacterium olei]TJZ53610.1 hypothetical protein FAZ15_16380 [Sphingobacterium olei]